ncbi:MAG: helix-turn-helix domain-containing protein [Chloroflexota bacterium]|nr:helix-turn-helix domain-containing protein [Chloroflexota bacterium]
MSAIDRLQNLGFSEYEAKAYVALLRSNPATGYLVSKESGVPRSMIYEVLNKLVARGAALSSPAERTTLYSPAPAEELLDRLRHEFEMRLDNAYQELTSLSSPQTMEYVWNIEGSKNILAKAREMIDHAEIQVHVGLLPETVPSLQPSLEQAIDRGLEVLVNTTSDIALPGARVMVTPLVLDDAGQLGTQGLLLTVDSTQALVSQQLDSADAKAAWTANPLLSFVVEQHMRTDIVIPRMFELLGHQALDLLDEQDRLVFAPVLETP